jgi:hypothetical protein
MAIPAVMVVVQLGMLFILSGLIVNLIQVFVIIPIWFFCVHVNVPTCYLILWFWGSENNFFFLFFLSMFYANQYFQIIVIVVIIIIFLLLLSHYHFFFPSRQIGFYTKIKCLHCISSMSNF